MLHVIVRPILADGVAIGVERGQIVHNLQPGEGVDELAVDLIGRCGDALTADSAGQPKNGRVGGAPFELAPV